MDFIDLIIGSEGILGIVSECTLKLQQKPSDYLEIFFSLPDEEEAILLVSHIRNNFSERFEGLSAFEYFGLNCRKYMDHEEQLFHGEDSVAIYIQQPLVNSAFEDAASEWLDILMTSNCSIDENAVKILDNERSRSIFFNARHSMPANSIEIVQQRQTQTIMTDTVVPWENFSEFLKYTHELIRSEDLEYLSFGHIGDSHLHFTILPDREQFSKGLEVYDKIVAKSAELKGVYSGEHGTGKRKRRDFLRCYGENAVGQICKCKAALDPQFLLNRGNVVDCTGLNI